MPHKARTPCKRCGYLKRQDPCPRCGGRPYDATWRRLAEATILRHVRLEGWYCPGLVTGTISHDRHPSRDLVVDHIDGNPLHNEQSNLRVICRSLNTSLRHQ